MIPDKIMTEVDRITEVSRKSLRKYISANPYDKFLMVAIPFIIDELMTIAGEMTEEELTEGDWWNKGFKETSEVKMYCPQHSGLRELASQIASKIYASK